MPPETPKPIEEQLPANISDFQAAEATKVETSTKIMEEVRSDMYAAHQGQDLLGRAAQLARTAEVFLPTVKLVDEQSDKSSVRILDKGTGRSQVVQPDGIVLSTMPAPDNRTIEFNPKAKPGEQYTHIEAGPPAKRTLVPEATIKDSPVATRTGTAGEQIQTFADGRIVTAFKTPGPGERATLTTFPPVPGLNDRPRSVETFTPNPAETTPERRAGRSLTKFADRNETELSPASTGEADKLQITKVTAFKNDGRAVLEFAPPSGRPGDNATTVTRFKAGHPPAANELAERAEIPATPPRTSAEVKTTFRDGSIESTYNPPKDGVKARLEVPGPQGFTQEIMANGDVKTTFTPPQTKTLFSHGENAGNPTEMNVAIKSITRSANGEYRITNQDGQVGPALRLSTRREDAPDRPIPLANTARTGDVFTNGSRTVGRTGDNTPPVPSDNPPPLPMPTERVRLNPETSMPDSTRVGDTAYAPKFDDRTGKVSELTIQPKDGPAIRLTRDNTPPPGFKVEAPAVLKDAQGRPLAANATGEAVLDGFTVKVVNGKIQGDFHVNKRGEVTYKTGDGPDRIEQIKKADGSLVKIDMKNYERTETGPPPTNTPRPTKFWDGFEWRTGEKKVEGGKTIVEFKPFDANKPATLERNGNPPNDTAVVKFKDATGKETKTISADWNARTQTEVVPGVPPAGPTTVTRMDAGGGNYREIEGQPVRNGDNVTVKFKPGRDNEPVSATYNTKDKTVATDYKNSRVVRDADGRVTEIQQPVGKPAQQFKYDGDGDMREQITLNADGTVKEKLVRTGPEKAPLMGAAVARDTQEQLGQPAQPGRPAPPRKIGEPTGFNTWTRVPAPNPATAENPATIQQNIFITADGAIIREKPPAPGSTAKADVSVEHPGRGTTETASGTRREFKGQDGQAWASADNGKTWKLPGMNGQIEGTPRSLADGTTVIRQTRTVPGTPPTTREVDIRRNEDPTSPSISELNATTGKETARRYDNGTLVQFDEAGNPRTRTVPGTPPTVQNFKFNGDKCTEISTGNPAVVTHKLEGGVLKPVNPEPTDLPVEVTKEGRILERTPATANPPNGTIERLGNNVSLVSDQAGNPVRMERQNGAQTETWDITSHRDSRNRVVVDKVEAKTPAPGRVIADATNGAIRLDGTGAVTQESVKGSGNFDRLNSLDGRVRVETATSRENTNDKFALKVDVAKNEGTLKPKDGPEWKLNYKPGAREGDVRQLDKITIPGIAGKTADEVIEAKPGPPPVTITVDENTGRVTVNRGDNTGTIFNPADPAKHRIDIANDGSSVTTNRDGLRTSLRNRTGEFTINEVSVPASGPPPALAGREIRSIVGPRPDGTAAGPGGADGNPKLSHSDGPITIDAANTVTQQKDKQEVKILSNGRVVTTDYAGSNRTNKTGVTIDEGNRRTKLNADGNLEQVLTRGTNGEYKAWEFTSTPPGAEKSLKFGPPPASEVKLPDTIAKVKLPDGTEVTRGTGEELVLRENGTLVRRPTTPGAQSRETVFNGDGTRNEVFRSAAPAATQWNVNMTGDRVTSFRLPGEAREIRVPAPVTPPAPDAISASLTNNELIISVGGQQKHVITANGQLMDITPQGRVPSTLRRRGT